MCVRLYFCLSEREIESKFIYVHALLLGYECRCRWNPPAVTHSNTQKQKKRARGERERAREREIHTNSGSLNLSLSRAPPCSRARSLSHTYSNMGTAVPTPIDTPVALIHTPTPTHSSFAQQNPPYNARNPKHTYNNCLECVIL